MTSVEQLSAAINRVRRSPIGGSMTVEIVLAAAEILAVMMDQPATVEWCDHHRRPYEFCSLWVEAGAAAGVCDPRVRAIGPETGRFG